MSQRSVIIVGAGIGGLAAAVRLAAKGFAVTVLEKNATVGGKLNTWEAPHPRRPTERPFRFDTGPSLLTLPFVFQDLYAAAGSDVRQHLPIKKLDPIARFVWSDGSQFELRNERSDLERQIRAIADGHAGDVDGWHRLLAHGQKIWDLGAELFLFHAPEQILSRQHEKEEGLAKRVVTGLSMLTVPVRIGMFSKFADRVDRCIKSPKLREVFYQYATYTGASPFSAPGTFAVIPFAETHFGGWYIEGGMYALATSLAKLARELGVEIRTNCAVERILIERRHKGDTAASPKEVAVSPFSAIGVLSNGQELRADAIVCNSDTIYSYRNLIDPSHRPHFTDEKLNRLEPGGSGLVILLGVEGTYPQLAHHTKFMPADYRGDLRAMFETRTVPDDPCIYVCASTRTDPTQAPDGCENLFVLCSAPAINGAGAAIDWTIEAPRYAQRIIETLEKRFGLTDLQKRIVVQRTISPLDLQMLYNANAGSIYGLGSSSRRDAFLRPPNRDKRIRNLHFAGGATHPGGGLPLVALSGKIVSELIVEDFAAADS